MIKRKKVSLKANAFSNWFLLAINVGIGVFLTPFIINNLGNGRYGIWTLVNSVIGYYGIINLGVGSAVTRYIALYTGKKDSGAINETASTTFAMFTVTAAIVTGFSLVFADTFADFFNVDESQKNEFVNTIIILGLTTGITFISNVFTAILTSREHYISVNFFGSILTLVRAMLIVIFVHNGFGITGVAFATFAVSVFQLIIKIVLYNYLSPDIKINFKSIKLNTLKILVLYGGITTIIQIADILRINIDSLVIGRFLTLEAVGIYGVAALLLRYMGKVIISGVSVLNPRFSNLAGSGDSNEQRRLLFKALQLASFISFGMTLFAIAFGPRFIVFWVGKEFAEASYVLIIVSAAYAFDLAQSPSIALLYAKNKHKYYAFYIILEAVANLLISIILVHKFGMTGVAIGTAIPMIISKCIIMPLYVCKIFNLSLKNYLKPFSIPLALSLIVLATIYSTGLSNVISNNDQFLFCVLACTVGAVYMIIALMFMYRDSLNTLLKSNFNLWTIT
ncbi:MAG: polysaccharide biosynthesis protein [Fibrobacter sp.]|mgnify:CR=1 FL=1|nr:polysaccharide biosynthesis protein [Fibrobacter sp.]